MMSATFRASTSSISIIRPGTRRPTPPIAARRWVDGLFAAAGTLSRLPERGRVVPELRRADVRELLLGSYRIVYRIEARRVAILTVRHLRRRFDPKEVG